MNNSAKIFVTSFSSVIQFHFVSLESAKTKKNVLQQVSTEKKLANAVFASRVNLFSSATTPVRTKFAGPRMNPFCGYKKSSFLLLLAIGSDELSLKCFDF